MALVHSRVRRVIYGISDPIMGGLGGIGYDHAVHCLPGTNHHYRVFQCSDEYNDNNLGNENCNLFQLCKNLHLNA